jgi:hypothetical protein
MRMLQRYTARELYRITGAPRAMGTRVARFVARRGGNASAASAISAISRVIGAASALSAGRRGYGKEKVYGSIP